MPFIIRMMIMLLLCLIFILFKKQHVFNEQCVINLPRYNMNGFYAIKLLEGQDVYRSEERRKGTPVYAEAMVCGGARARN